MIFEKSDDQLMQEIAGGNERAFRTLFQRHSAKVLGYSAKLLGSRDRAEDLSQEIWMKIVRLAPSYESKNQFSAWIMTLTRNAAFDVLRLQKNESDDELDSIPDSTKDDIETVLAKEQSVEEIKLAISELPESQRIALTLWMTEDLSYEEIARQMDLSVSSVKSLLFRARESLQKKLESK